MTKIEFVLVFIDNLQLHFCFEINGDLQKVKTTIINHKIKKSQPIEVIIYGLSSAIVEYLTVWRRLRAN